MHDKNRLIEYCNSDSAIELQDVFKFLYQSCFGCEHLVADSPMILERIKEEMADADKDDLPEIEMLDGDYCRVHLKMIGNGLTEESLADMFVRSAKAEPRGNMCLQEKLATLKTCARDGRIPFTEEDVDAAIENWRVKGFCPVHHSEKFRNAHHPAYRVVEKSFVL